MTTHNLRFLGGALALLVGIASSVHANVPSMGVTVFDEGGKVAFKGSIGADATFSTPNLQPGHYVVQFNTKSANAKGNQYLVVVSAGKKKVVATDVAGETFIRGGAAMRVNVERDLKITGQLADEQAMASEGAEYRVIGGQRFVWVRSELGTNLGGRWVEASAMPAINRRSVAAEALRNAQNTAGEGSMIRSMRATETAQDGH
jgi:hypothetical protein